MDSPPPRRRRLSISWADKVAATNPQLRPNRTAPPVVRLRRKTASQAEDPPVGLPVRTQDLHNLKATIQAPKVALASCTKGCHAERLREWLFWHLAKGIQLVLFRWEGPLGPEHQAILEDSRMKHRVILLEHSLEGKASGSFQRVMTRQIKFVHRAIKFARERGFDFLLHLDDDELLYPEAMSIPELLEKHVKSTKRCVHFENLEAIFQFQLHHGRPFSRASTRFRQDHQVLYCNGKSAANLTAPGEVFASGVHHFCQHDRAFKEADPKFGLHDKEIGCSHPDCCIQERRAHVLHFDCPSFAEWQSKFAIRASADMTPLDHEEMDLFPFKKSSMRVMKQDVNKQKRVYRYWRCLPGRKEEKLHPRLTGTEVEAEFERLLAEARSS